MFASTVSLGVCVLLLTLRLGYVCVCVSVDGVDVEGVIIVDFTDKLACVCVSVCAFVFIVGITDTLACMCV